MPYKFNTQHSLLFKILVLQIPLFLFGSNGNSALPHTSGSPEFKMAAGLVSSEASLLGLQTADISLPECLPKFPPFYKDIVIGLGPKRKTSFNSVNS